jgi:hypothetical protein
MRTSMQGYELTTTEMLQTEGGLRFAAPDPNLTPKELAALLREREKITRAWLKANNLKKN